MTEIESGVFGMSMRTRRENWIHDALVKNLRSLAEKWIIDRCEALTYRSIANEERE